MKLDWNPEKNKWLKSERNISLEDIALLLAEGRRWKAMDRPNHEKCPNQRIFQLPVDRRIYFAPFAMDGRNENERRMEDLKTFLREKAPNWVKPFARSVIRKYREKTSSKRLLPDFMIIGAQKSGTSSLYHYLSQHPQLMLSSPKEVHFFDGGLEPNVDSFNKGEAWYRSHFPLKRNARRNRKAFEASPLYLFNPLVPQRISELIPEVKLIAVLRNPVERAISHYFHEKRRGYESLPLMEALQAEEERLRSSLDKRDYKSNAFIHHSYKSRGLYHKQLKRYFDYFPKNHILVISSEALFTQPRETLRSVFQFVDADAEFAVKNLKPQNVGGNRSEIDPEVYGYLNDYFRSSNLELCELIGENYGWS